ncbi:MAG TPA: O-antigen ligase family protein [Thermoanaerobaculia bacterium]
MIEKQELAALAVLAPFFLFPPVGRPLLTVILLLPCVWIFAAVRRESILPRTELNGSLALLVVMVLVSLFATYDVLFSAPKVLGVVFGIVLFFAIVRAIRGRATLENALDLFSLAGAALAIVGLLGTNWIDKMPLLRGVTAHLPAVIRGVPGQTEGFQPNAIAGALVMFLPLQFALCIASSARRPLHVAAFAISSFTFLLTQSRGGHLSLFAGVITWALWAGRRSRLAAIATVLLLAVLAAGLHDRLQPLLNEQVGSGVAADVPSRIEMWSRAVRIIGDFPITGIGMNTFRRVMPAMYPVFLTPPEIDVAHAHNHLLQVALDLGIPGLIAFLAVWFGAASLLTRTYRVAPDAWLRWIAGGAAAGMIAYFAFGTVDAIALGAKVGIFFWIALALIVSLHKVAEQPA